MGLQTHYCSCQKSIKKGPMNPICLNIGGASHHLDSREEFRLAFQRFLQPWVIDYIKCWLLSRRQNFARHAVTLDEGYDDHKGLHNLCWPTCRFVKDASITLSFSSPTCKDIYKNHRYWQSWEWMEVQASNWLRDWSTHLLQLLPLRLYLLIHLLPDFHSLFPGHLDGDINDGRRCRWQNWQCQ